MIVVQVSLRFLLGVALVASGVVKLIWPEAFLTAVIQYELLDATAVQLVAVILPAVEVVAGVALMTHQFKRGGALVAVALGLIFIAVQVGAIARSLPISCGCFGPLSGERIGPASLGRAAAVTLLALAVLFLETRSHLKRMRQAERPLVPRKLSVAFGR